MTRDAATLERQRPAAHSSSGQRASSVERGAAAVRADELPDIELPHAQRGRSARRVRRLGDLPGPVGTVARPLDRQGQESLRTRRGARLDRESQVVVEVSIARRETWPRAPKRLRPTANAVTHNRISTSSARNGTPPARTGAAGTPRAIWPTTSSRRTSLARPDTCGGSPGSALKPWAPTTSSSRLTQGPDTP